MVHFKPISDRMCYLRIRGRYQHISIINIHAHTEEKEDDTKNEHYELLEEEYSKLPGYDLKIILGDENAKIGREEEYRPAIGSFSKHDVTNDNGKRLIDFARGGNMIVKSTCFQLKEIQKDYKFIHSVWVRHGAIQGIMAAAGVAGGFTSTFDSAGNGFVMNDFIMQWTLKHETELKL